MRFVADGPDIPEEILRSRDAGNVVFVCGAGVSMAKANLPSFGMLVDGVLTRLHADSSSEASSYWESASGTDERYNPHSVDRVFTLLEREFRSTTIHEAVARELEPSDDVDLSAHKTILDLAITPNGERRLVTTNFDRLFECCDVDLVSWVQPHIPDVSREPKFAGIVYLHGCVDHEYTKSEKGGLILSSSEFGGAYLADANATSFIKEVLAQNHIIFLGYSASDPPMSYLLEGLQRVGYATNRLFAFESSENREIEAEWNQKGVNVIGYKKHDSHEQLWQTLELWAERARNPKKWVSDIVSTAATPPSKLQAHERGQVAHVIGESEGAKTFAIAEPVPPAEWLCVFDSTCRYGNPGPVGSYDRKGQYVDPFELFGIDSDPSPEVPDPKDHFYRREVPDDVWDPLIGSSPTSSDHPTRTSRLIGHGCRSPVGLTETHHWLTRWITKVSNDPVSVWWASGQQDVHPVVLDSLKRHITSKEADKSDAASVAWSQLIEVFESHHDLVFGEIYELDREARKFGWCVSTPRRIAAALRPYLKAERPMWWSVAPPPPEHASEIANLLSRDVEYPDESMLPEVPDEFLGEYLQWMRFNLLLAEQLEFELGGMGLQIVNPISDDNDPANHRSKEHRFGLSAFVSDFAQKFENLVNLDPAVASDEFEMWPSKRSRVFTQLRVWACGLNSLVPPQDVADEVISLEREDFWSMQLQRDLLMTLRNRWNDFDFEQKRSVEAKIIEGRAAYDSESPEEYQERKAWLALNRLVWLEDRGCELSANGKEAMYAMRETVPDWEPEHSRSAMQGAGIQVGWIGTDESFESLLMTPLNELISQIEELTSSESDPRKPHDPFLGLSKAKPVRAYRALSLAVKSDEYPHHLWRTFLSADLQGAHNVRLAFAIATRLVRLPTDEMSEMLPVVCDWLRAKYPLLVNCSPETTDLLFEKSVSILATAGGNQIAVSSVDTRGHDWVSPAINSPSGRLAEALLADPRISSLRGGEGLPVNWMNQAESLIALDGNSRRYALVLFAHHLLWLFHKDRDWSVGKLFQFLETEDDEDREAMWSGLFWGNRFNLPEFYEEVKPYLLSLADSTVLRFNQNERAFACWVLAGWKPIDFQSRRRLISHDELRSAILTLSERGRGYLINCIVSWSQDSEAGGEWREILEELFSEAWPLQKSVASAKTTAALASLLLNQAEQFDSLSRAIMPVLGKVDLNLSVVIEIKELALERSREFPNETLEVLQAVLPENPSIWPEDIRELVNEIRGLI